MKGTWNALAVIAVAVLFHRAPNLATAEQCNDSPPAYSGRFFQMTAINHTDSMANLSTPSVYACNHLCGTTNGCIALQYKKSTERPSTKCKLYNLTNVQKYFIGDPESDVILRLPISCGQNSTVNGGWTAWSAPPICPVTCGESTSYTLTRNCSDPVPHCNGEFCDGPSEKPYNCTVLPCPVWQAWSDYGECSATCGYGTQGKTRTCSVAGECDSGSSSETTTCSLGNCPVWQAWSGYGECSATCGYGTQEKTRACSVAGECDSGSSFETKTCDAGTCPGRLRHRLSELCLAYDPSRKIIVLDHLCNQRFQMINNRIYKAGTMECLKPQTATWNSWIELTTACDDPLCELKFSTSTSNTIVNTNTNLCFHQSGGKDNPPSGTPLLLYRLSTEDRLKYDWD